MLPEQRRRSLLARRIVNVVAALAVSAAVLTVLGAGYRMIPALGPALDPGHGAWTSASSGSLPGSQTLRLAGLAHPVQVSFSSQGIASISAATDSDLFLALGYVQARFRISQMDLERRLGEGRLAQLVGPSAVTSDEFELRLGLLRTARQEWADMPRSSLAARALIAYSRGVNDYLAGARVSHQWPAVFSLPGIYPANWTPVDSLVIQGVLTQELDFTTTPLDYALLERSLGTATTMAWFPIRAPGQQHPYDPGPYRDLGIAPIIRNGKLAAAGHGSGRAASRASGRTSAAGLSGSAISASAVLGSATAGGATAGGATAGAATAGGAGSRASGTTSAAGSSGSAISASAVLGGATASGATTSGTGSGSATSGSAASGAELASSMAGGGLVSGPSGISRAAAAILADVSSLPAGQVHEYSDSNAWAANGPKVAGGGALLAGDPHLPQTLPSIWFQVALSAPGLAVSGVSTPGLPGVLIGHNADIAWSLTDTQNQSAMFYDEKTSKSRPGEYFWRGRWRRMRQVHYTIDVRGEAARKLTVDITVHGPVLTTAGQTVSVDWMGVVPSPDLAVLLQIDQAGDFAQFSAALASWRAPTENFVYADRRGNIGAISAGYFPLVRHGDPWLPMPGTGPDDVAGVIPQAAVPHVYDPRGHVIATANQRPVGSSYPYYIGTAANDFDPGYRAATEQAYLDRHSSMTRSSFATLQASLSDGLARQIVPRLLAALRRAKLTPVQRQARQVLAGWHYTMEPQSAAASIWSAFWGDYLSAVFQPWWTARQVPVRLDRSGLKVGPGQFSLDEVLAYWTRDDQHNAAFSPPGDPGRDAATLLRAAFATAVAQLRSKPGGAPASWSYGKLHSRRFVSLTGAAALGYGPRAAGGDAWTVDAAYGSPVSSAGPSWRMIVGWTGSGRPSAEGIYPGGQSENPASPWYENLVPDWWSGRYLPMPVAGRPAGRPAGRVRWQLRPAGAAA